MSKIGSLLSSMWNNKCPRCRQASLFREPINLKKPLDMPPRCPSCDLNFEPEPGFYFGAMFISYGITTVFFMAIAAVCVIYYGMSAEAMMGVVIFAAVITYIKVMRLSRSVFIHILIRFESKYTKKTSAAKH